LTREELIAFHRRFYVAKNAVVSIVGAIPRQQAEQIAERLTTALPAGEHAPALPPVPGLEGAKVERIAFPSSQSHLYLGQPGMRRGDPDYFPLYVGNHIFGGSGLVSLLSEEVREKRGLSYSVYSYFLPMRRPGIFQLGLQTKNAQASEALKVMQETLQRFIDRGPSEEELKEAKQNITGGFPLRIASNSKIIQYLAVIGFYDLPLDYLDRFNEREEAVTIEQISDAFRRRVDPQRLVTVQVGQVDQPLVKVLEK
jgi:zinc protease